MQILKIEDLEDSNLFKVLENLEVLKFDLSFEVLNILEVLEVLEVF